METYKDIPRFPNYEISESGTVRNKKTLRILKYSWRKSRCATYYAFKLKSDANVFETVSVHRLVAITYIPNIDNKPCIDHIDGDTKNNSVTNLRWATVAENNQNRRIACNNTSGHKGVYLHSLTKKYMAYITLNKKMVYLGLYETKEEAALKVAEARKIAHGDYARNG